VHKILPLKDCHEKGVNLILLGVLQSHTKILWHYNSAGAHMFLQ
jgi:hypothetical protein